MTTSVRLSHAIRLIECSGVHYSWPYFDVSRWKWIFQVIICSASKIVWLGTNATIYYRLYINATWTQLNVNSDNTNNNGVTNHNLRNHMPKNVKHLWVPSKLVVSCHKRVWLEHIQFVLLQHHEFRVKQLEKRQSIVIHSQLRAGLLTTGEVFQPSHGLLSDRR